MKPDKSARAPRKRALSPQRSDAEKRELLFAFLLLAAGILLRFLYLEATPWNVRQHDVYSLASGKGHAGYIAWFFENMRLPDFDPTSRSQFYHPPLHHFLSAVFLKLEQAVGLISEPDEQTIGDVQLLTFLYSSLVPAVFYRLLKKFDLKGAGLFIPLAIVCFHPGLIIMGGSINNDMLVTLLTLAAFTAAVGWYQKPTVGRIAAAALLMGLAMLTKLSAALAAPAIALLFLARAVKDIRAAKGDSLETHLRYIFCFMLFALICCPLGLWWPIRGKLLYDIPLGYVPSLSLTSHQYVGDYSLWARTFGFTAKEFSSPYIAWADLPGHDYYEYNLFVGLLKTGVFDESTLFAANGSDVGFVGRFAGVILLICEAALILLSIGCATAAFIREQRLGDKTTNASVFVLWFTVLLSYVSFCFKYPHTCTMNFRYAVPAMWASVMFIGRAVAGSEERTAGASGEAARERTNLLRGCAITLTLLFALASVIQFAMLLVISC